MIYNCLEFLVMFFIALFLVKERIKILIFICFVKFIVSFLIDFIFLKYTDCGVYSINISSVVSNIDNY